MSAAPPIVNIIVPTPPVLGVTRGVSPTSTCVTVVPFEATAPVSEITIVYTVELML